MYRLFIKVRRITSNDLSWDERPW